MTIADNRGWETEDPSQPMNEVISFPDEWKEEFEGLLFLGYLQHEVKRIPFHSFVIKTLNINEKLEVSLIAKPYLESVGYNRAWKAAVVAAALVSIDGRPLIPSNKTTNVVKQKYDYVVNNWYDTTIDLLYEELDMLENKVIMVLQELNIIEPIMPVNIFDDDNKETDNPKDGN